MRQGHGTGGEESLNMVAKEVGEATTFVAGAYDSVGSCGRGRCGWRVRHAIVATTSVRRRWFLCIQIGMYSDMCVLS